MSVSLDILHYYSNLCPVNQGLFLGKTSFFTGIFPGNLLQPFLQPDIISKKLDHGKMIGDPGKNTFRVGVSKDIQGQIGGYDRRFLPCQPFVETEKQLGIHKRIGQFCSKVIDDQKITVIDMIRKSVILRMPFKPFLGKQLEKLL